MSYCAKKNKNVLLMSTVHKEATISEREDRKPQMILDYNKTKSGVDTLDKVFATLYLLLLLLLLLLLSKLNSIYN